MVKDANIRRHQLLEFFKENSDAFEEYEKQRVLDYVKYGDDSSFIPDLAREIYDELGFMEDKHNIYLGFIDLLREAFPIEEAKILEVGGGILPRLGKRISELQTTGNIIIYDPRLSIYEKDTPKMKLVRSRFTKKENIGDRNLMIAFMPCEGAEPFIESATDHNTDFMLGFCEGGPHGDCYDYYEDAEEWLHSMMYLARRKVEENHMGKVKVKSLEQYGDPYPVIYNER